MLRNLLLATLVLAAVAGCRIEGDPEVDPVASTCNPVTYACRDHADCCSFACVNGACIANTVVGGLCRTSDDCSSLIDMKCIRGQCKTGYQCLGLADVCPADNDCCTGNCVGDAAFPQTDGICGGQTAPVAADGSATLPYFKTATLGPIVATDAEGDTLRYEWVLSSVNGAPPATPWSGIGATPSFFPSLDADYAFTVVVTDGPASQRMRYSDTARFTLHAVNLAPVVEADPSNATSSSLRNRALTLAGTVSDPNLAAAPVSCGWFAKPPGGAETPVPGGSWASCPATPTVTFTPPIDGLEGPWEFRLEASDGALTTSDVRVVTITNAAPVALACAYECQLPPPGGIPFVRVGNLGPPGARAPAIPLHGSATDDNSDETTAGFSWEWRLKAVAPSSFLSPHVLASGTGSTRPYDASFEPDAVGTFTLELHVDDGRGATADTTVPVLVEPWLRPLHPGDGGSDLLPRGWIADAAYFHAASADDDRLVFAGYDTSSSMNRLWVLDPEAPATIAVPSADLPFVPTSLAINPEGAVLGRALVGGVEATAGNPPRWMKVTLGGTPSAGAANPFGPGWTGSPYDVVDAAGREYAVSVNGDVHQIGTGAGSNSSAPVECTNCMGVVGSHAVGTSGAIWLLGATGELRRFDVVQNGRLTLSPNTSVSGQAASSDLWLSASHGTRQLALSAGPIFDAALLTSVDSLPSPARHLDSIAPSGLLQGVMVNAAGTGVVKLDGSYGDAGALRVPRVGYLGTGYPLEAWWAFVRSDGTAHYVVLRAVVASESRWFLMKY